jgi:hypothetical protein
MSCHGPPSKSVLNMNHSQELLATAEQLRNAALNLDWRDSDDQVGSKNANPTLCSSLAQGKLSRYRYVLSSQSTGIFKTKSRCSTFRDTFSPFLLPSSLLPINTYFQKKERKKNTVANYLLPIIHKKLLGWTVFSSRLQI